MTRRLLLRLGEAPPVRGAVAEVREALEVLLGSRSGAPAAPDFGLPFASDLVGDPRGARTILRRSIAAAIARHEPRLRDVEVYDLTDDDPLQLRFAVTATLDTPAGARRTRFITQLRRDALARVAID